jgi:hypothetical protein
VRTAVSQFVRKSGGELSLQLLQLADYILAWTISWLWFGLSDQALVWCAILGERCATLCLAI